MRNGLVCSGSKFDVVLYRKNAHTLRTNSSLEIAGNVTTASGKITAFPSVHCPFAGSVSAARVSTSSLSTTSNAISACWLVQSLVALIRAVIRARSRNSHCIRCVRSSVLLVSLVPELGAVSAASVSATTSVSANSVAASSVATTSNQLLLSVVSPSFHAQH